MKIVEFLPFITVAIIVALGGCKQQPNASGELLSTPVEPSMHFNRNGLLVHCTKEWKNKGPNKITVKYEFGVEKNGNKYTGIVTAALVNDAPQLVKKTEVKLENGSEENSVFATNSALQRISDAQRASTPSAFYAGSPIMWIKIDGKGNSNGAETRGEFSVFADKEISSKNRTTVIVKGGVLALGGSCVWKKPL